MQSTVSSFPASIGWGKLKSGEFRTVEIPIKASMEILDRQREVRVEITDELNRDSLPLHPAIPHTKWGWTCGHGAFRTQEKPGLSMWSQGRKD